MSDEKVKRVPHLSLQLVALTLARIFLNTGLRMVYPFAPAFARGLGVPIADVARVVALRNATGFLAPALGHLSDRHGRRTIVIWAMLLFGGGAFVVLAMPNLLGFAIALSVMAIAKNIFDPSMQAHVGESVSYEKRGRAIAFTEYSWSLSLLIGAPLVGLAIARSGWRSPFVWLGALSIASILFLYPFLPSRHMQAGIAGQTQRLWSVLRKHPVIAFTFIYYTLAMMANEMLLIVFGGWMEVSFQLNLAGLGLAAAVIGGSEIVGETVAGFSTDHFGKRPVVITAGLLCAAFYLLLPALGTSYLAAMVMLFLLFLAFEVTIVGGLPLISETVRGARTVAMSMLIAAHALGRTLGALIGPQLLQAVGMQTSGVVWALIMVMAMVILIKWIHEEK